MSEKTLNPKRQAFCREYVIDHNGKQAAIRAGYSEKTARTQANQLLMILDVEQEVSRIEAENRAKYAADRAGRQKFWADTMNKESVPLPDRLRASELLGKSEADFITVTRDITETSLDITPEQAQRWDSMAEAAMKDMVNKPHLSRETG